MQTRRGHLKVRENASLSRRRRAYQRSCCRWLNPANHNDDDADHVDVDGHENWNLSSNSSGKLIEHQCSSIRRPSRFCLPFKYSFRFGFGHFSAQIPIVGHANNGTDQCVCLGAPMWPCNLAETRRDKMRQIIEVVIGLERPINFRSLVDVESPNEHQHQQISDLVD